MPLDISQTAETVKLCVWFLLPIHHGESSFDHPVKAAACTWSLSRPGRSESVPTVRSRSEHPSDVVSSRTTGTATLMKETLGEKFKKEFVDMPAVHPRYMCHCPVPTPKKKDGEDTGICAVCNCLIDEDLYERRLRQHTSGWHYASVHDYLMDVDLRYRELIQSS